MRTDEQRAAKAAYMRELRARKPEQKRNHRLAAKAKREADPVLKAEYDEQRRRAARRQRAARVDMRIKDNLRTRTRMAIYGYKRGIRKAGGAVRDLGCSIGQLLKHLESQFTDGMTWDNYGEWELDHIKPLSLFDLSDRDQFVEASNYKNLQPLWKADNRLKGAKT